MIHWELRKKLKFHYTYKWYVHKPETVLENDTYKTIWDFEIQMDHLIQARRPDLLLSNKKKRTCHPVDFTISADHRMKIEISKKIEKYLDLAKELTKLWNMEVTVIAIVISAFGRVLKGREKRLG